MILGDLKGFEEILRDIKGFKGILTDLKGFYGIFKHFIFKYFITFQTFQLF